ncbi:CAP domain-containing protein [Robertkochia aurantiaca]|uniref:CAP domain-containing protein n=1 Tax=Robertkochia aurantiaca TaxID=2873700 RepID=UPI001CCE1578|nr:CAP domain-containing protein [Robertkochia sp. 3YJGBD-33]
MAVVCFHLSCSSENEVEQVFTESELEIKATLEETTLDLVNDYRVVEKSLNGLNPDEVIYEKALELAHYMAENKILSHHEFVKRAEFLNEKLGATDVAENISRNFDDPVATVEQWKLSISHNSTMIGDYTHTAVAVVKNPDGEVYYVQMFANIP